MFFLSLVSISSMTAAVKCADMREYNIGPNEIRLILHCNGLWYARAVWNLTFELHACNKINYTENYCRYCVCTELVVTYKD